MRLVVFDTSLLLSAFLSRTPRPHGRSLMALFALGALTFHEHTLEEEALLLRQEADLLGATLVSRPIDEELDAVRERRAYLRDQLPVRAPDDLCLVGSVRLFDEVERKVQEV